ncbi:MAG: Phosphoribosylaminoimidazole-succinocarboxamide synthase [Methanonatronarchaeales archaeon]|nr:Phosphoribosylaminoimidazole-succinocarboxamide synthase [Methanonatronarchaeales archaeon]
MEPLYSGKAKSMYETDDPSVLRMVFRDDVTAFDAEKVDRIEGKGRYNAEICASVFEYLEGNGVETHFLERTGDAEMLVERLDIYALEVIPRNIATGSLVRKYPFEEGQELDPPVVVMDLKSDEYGDPMLNDDIVRALGIAGPGELEEIRDEALRVNNLLLEMVDERGLLLPDFKLEFGKRTDGEIVLGDEVSPDTCRFWTEGGRSLDKDVFRFDRGDLAEAYAEAAERILA